MPMDIKSFSRDWVVKPDPAQDADPKLQNSLTGRKSFEGPSGAPGTEAYLLNSSTRRGSWPHSMGHQPTRSTAVGRGTPPHLQPGQRDREGWYEE